MSRPGECRNVYDFWRGLGHRMGLEEYFPWKNINELFDHRLSRLNMSFENFCSKYKIKINDYKYYGYRKTGFATPSGKVELKSSVLEQLGCDPLPYYRNVEVSEAYPLKLFVGLREPQFFQSGQRHNRKLRKGNKFPRTFIHKNDAAKYGITEGEWVTVETVVGKIHMMATFREDLPEGLIRIPHGWWLPEETDLGSFEHNDAILIPDSDDYLDKEQGIPHLKGVPCKVYPRKQQREYINMAGLK